MKKTETHFFSFVFWVNFFENFFLDLGDQDRNESAWKLVHNLLVHIWEVGSREVEAEVGPNMGMKLESCQSWLIVATRISFWNRKVNLI